MEEKWYIDRSRNFYQFDLKNMLMEIDKLYMKDEKLCETTKLRGLLETQGINPNDLRPADFTRYRDHGLIDYDNHPGKLAKLYINDRLTFGELTLLHLTKRGVDKKEKSSIKPFIIICNVFYIMMQRYQNPIDIILTISECITYLVDINDYSNVNEALIDKIISSRIYKPGNNYPEEISIKENDRTNIGIWFNALMCTPLFCKTEQKTILVPNRKQIKFFEFIYMYGYKISEAPINNRDLYEYYCSSESGLIEIVPEVTIKCNDLTLDEVKILYEYLFAYNKDKNTNFSKYFDNDYFGIFFPFISIPQIAILKLSLKNHKIANLFYDFSKNAANYNELYEDNSSYIISNLSTNHNNSLYPIYTEHDLLKDCFISKNDLKTIQRLIERKNNIILEGPPGVGKTFLAERIAYYMLGMKDASKIKKIQFHQSYSYEDFVMGYKPDKKGNFSLINGVFYDFCKDASKNSGYHFFIIDEINRGNLSKIFGELLFLIEKDKRDLGIELLYKNEQFFVPKNIFIIGIMNSVDKSLSRIDFALMRRFSFYTLEPAFGKENFIKFLSEIGVSKILNKHINEKMLKLNGIISKDPVLGKDFRIGHSYFCENMDNEKFNDIIKFDIEPLLNEYWIENLDKVRSIIKDLLI